MKDLTRVTRPLALAIVTISMLGAQQPPAPTFRSGSDLLTLEVAVRDKAGQPITDLQPSDFEVTIDGRPRSVVVATRFGHGARNTAGTPLPGFVRASDASPGRVVIIAVDRDSIQAGSERVILESTSAMLASLTQADAVGVVGLPVGGIDPTRDHRAAADAIRLMTGTKPQSIWSHKISWDEVVAYERQDRITIARVVERECIDSRDLQCGSDLARQARDMLISGRGQAQTNLTRLGNLFDRLQGIRAPKHLVLLSGGLPFDADLLTRYNELAAKAAQAHVAISILFLDQPDFDPSNRTDGGSTVGGREYGAGLATIASTTGGVFLNGVGRATGALARIASDITDFYQLGVDAQSSDADGRAHRLEVKVKRNAASVRAPSQIASVRPVKSSTADDVAHALLQPTDVTELPLEVATYVTHAGEPDKVRVLVSAALADATAFVPAEWGYVVLDAKGNVMGGTQEEIAREPSASWGGTSSAILPPGNYRLRTALISADGRFATLDRPLAIGLRAAGAVQASDLIVGTRNHGQLQPAARLTQRDGGLAMIELSSTESLAGTVANVELTRAGTTQTASRTALQLQARVDDPTIVVAEAPLDLSALAPGTYRASVVLEKDGKPFGRISRLVDIVPGGSGNPPAHSTSESAPAPARRTRDSGLDDLLDRAGRYIATYGEQASLIVAVEHYRQRYQNAPLGQPSGRDLVAELALVKTSDTIGWVGFRDVVSVDGKAIRDRQDRLMGLFRSGTPDLAEARRIADESARFNIGPTRRNFNDPTAALFFFLPGNQARFEFSRKGTTKIDGVDAVEIEFSEKSSPTLIRTQDGHDVASQGSLWVNPADGTVLRTRLIVSGFAGVGSSARVETTFGRNERLGMWVPATMTERSDGKIQRSRDAFATAASVTATATYGEFKRFGVSTSTTFKH